MKQSIIMALMCAATSLSSATPPADTAAVTTTIKNRFKKGAYALHKELASALSKERKRTDKQQRTAFKKERKQAQQAYEAAKKAAQKTCDEQLKKISMRFTEEKAARATQVAQTVDELRAAKKASRHAVPTLDALLTQSASYLDVLHTKAQKTTSAGLTRKIDAERTWLTNLRHTLMRSDIDLHQSLSKKAPRA